MSPGAEQPRPRPPQVGTERTQLAGWLEHERAALLDALLGLDEAALRSAPAPVGVSLLDIVVELTAREAHWFRGVLDRQPLASPDRRGAHAAVEDIVHAYRAEIARSRMVLARYELDRRVDAEGARVTTRWVVLQMVVETARRNGQAQVLRALLQQPDDG